MEEESEEAGEEKYGDIDTNCIVIGESGSR
jgi:hypothetical protein